MRGSARSDPLIEGGPLPSKPRCGFSSHSPPSRRRRAPRARSPGWRERAAGRPCPASSSGSSIPRRSRGSRRGSRRARPPLSATNGKTTTAAMTAEILGGRVRLAHNRSGANLVSGIASALLASEDAELGLFEVDEAALPQVASLVRPRVLCLGNLFRDQLDRYGELELIAERWRTLVRELPADATLVVNGDDPQLGALVERAARRGRLRARRPAAGAPRRATACGRLDALRPLRGPLPLPRGVRRPSRRLRVPALRESAAGAHALGKGDRARRARERVVRPSCARRAAPGHAPPAGPLQRLQRARRGGARPRARRLARRGRLGSRALRCGLRALRADRDGRPPAADAPDQEPRWRERGGSHAGRRRRPDPRRGRAERRDRGRQGRVLDLGRRLRALARRARARDRHRRPRRGAGAPLQVRRVRPRGDRGRPVARARPRPRARADAGRRRSSSCCRRTPRCSLCAGSSPSAATCRSTGSARREDRRRASLSGLPEHLRRPREHRRARASRRVARARARGAACLGGGRAGARRARPPLHRRRPGPRAGARRARPPGQARRAARRRGRGGAAVLAVCGGYQLLGRYYRVRERRRPAGRRPVPAAHDRRRATDDRRHPARRRADSRRAPDDRRLREPRRPHVPRRGRRAARPSRGRLRQRRRERRGGLPRRPRDRDLPPRPAAPAQPVARRLAARRRRSRTATGGEAPVFEPLPDELEREAHAVSSQRAHDRGGRS